MHGIAHYARSRSPSNLKPTGHAAGMQMRPPCAGQAHALTLKRALSARLDKPHIDAARPAAVRRPLHDVGICELLGHGAKHRSHTSQPEAKNTRRSKLPVTGHDLEVTGHDPRRARWLEAHKVRHPWPRHDKGVPAAHRHAVDIAQMIGFNRSARV